jgi:hypothetical protein
MFPFFSWMTQFASYVIEISDTLRKEVSSIFNAIASLSAAITSFLMVDGETFPNVTMPHFEVHGALNNNISKALQVSFAPLVKLERR